MSPRTLHLPATDRSSAHARTTSTPTPQGVAQADQGAMGTGPRSRSADSSKPIERGATGRFPATDIQLLEARKNIELGHGLDASQAMHWKAAAARRCDDHLCHVYGLVAKRMMRAQQAEAFPVGYGAATVMPL